MLNKGVVFLFIGVTGLVISLLGLIHSPAQSFYIIGSTLLLITAIHFKLFYFIALEIILIAGHSAILLGIGTILQVAIPILLCVQLLAFYFFIGHLNNIYLIIGIIGIAALSIGLAYENNWIFFIGGAAIALYAYFYSYKNPAALLWAVLNTIFALTAMIRIILPIGNFQ